MSENLSSQHTQPPVETDGSSVEELRTHRKNFVSQLVGNGLISDDLANSDELDSFTIDEATQYDALMHILVGGKEGGVHHLETVFRLDLPKFNIAAASQLYAKKTSPTRLRRRQSVRENGTYKPERIIINGQRKEFGSAMFPNEWSTEDVIRNVLIVSRSAPESHDLERSTFTHLANIEGVDIKVVTSEKTGKIITGFPLVPKGNR